jgi:hypothetical protein
VQPVVPVWSGGSIHRGTHSSMDLFGHNPVPLSGEHAAGHTCLIATHIGPCETRKYYACDMSAEQLIPPQRQTVCSLFVTGVRSLWGLTGLCDRCNGSSSASGSPLHRSGTASPWTISRVWVWNGIGFRGTYIACNTDSQQIIGFCM